MKGRSRKTPRFHSRAAQKALPLNYADVAAAIAKRDAARRRGDFALARSLQAKVERLQRAHLRDEVRVA